MLMFSLTALDSYLPQSAGEIKLLKSHANDRQNLPTQQGFKKQ